MEYAFEQRLQTLSLSLTKKGHLVAQYIMNNKDTAAFMPATAVADKIGVSDVTVHRFAQQLGYANYSELQKDLQLDISNQLQNQKQRYRSPGEHMTDQYGDTLDDSLVLIDEVAKKNFSNLEDALQKLSASQLEKASQALSHSNRVYVVGFWGASVLAEGFALKFLFNSANVVSITKTTPENIAQILSVGKDDCVTVYSYGRYPKMATKLTQYAKKRGAKIIAMTDKETSPICPYADYAFFSPVGGVSFSSLAGPLLLTEILLSYTTGLMKETQKKHHDAIEDIVQELNYFC